MYVGGISGIREIAANSDAIEIETIGDLRAPPPSETPHAAAPGESFAERGITGDQADGNFPVGYPGPGPRGVERWPPTSPLPDQA